ncbi:MAG: MarR family winged helix-turn-helix transcriptional regulator [Patulibacter minatonensis]
MSPSDSAPGADVRAPDRLHELPTWQASQVAAAGARLVEQALAADGLRRHDYRVLVAIDEHEGGAASQADLGRAVWLDRSDLHGVVTGLERRGLVSRHPDPADARRKLVELSPAGARALADLHRRIDAAQDLLLAPLSPADRATFLRLLGELAEQHGRS